MSFDCEVAGAINVMAVRRRRQKSKEKKTNLKKCPVRPGDEMSGWRRETQTSHKGNGGGKTVATNHGSAMTEKKGKKSGRGMSGVRKPALMSYRIKFPAVSKKHLMILVLI